MLAAAFILGSVLTVSAQIIPPFSPGPAAVPDDEAEAAEAPDVNDPDVLKGIDVDKLDWGQLAIDAGTAQRHHRRQEARARPPPRTG